MDWARAIDRNRDDLIDIVTRLFLLAGIRTGLSVILLPRSLHIRILAMLRPAEFAARRLIVMAACGLKFTLRPSGGRNARASNSVILGLVPEDDGAGAASRLVAETLPAFTLFDPWKRYGHPWLEDDQAAPWHEPQTQLAPDDLINARGLTRRIRALERALQDVEGQAARLARWRARRHLESCRPKRWSPMRPGRPPGWRKRPKTPAEAVLKECHSLALHAWDTS